jgi:hypothetical protein
VLPEWGWRSEPKRRQKHRQVEFVIFFTISGMAMAKKVQVGAISLANPSITLGKNLAYKPAEVSRFSCGHRSEFRILCSAGVSPASFGGVPAAISLPIIPLPIRSQLPFRALTEKM